jgi:hypothetical protein
MLNPIRQVSQRQISAWVKTSTVQYHSSDVRVRTFHYVFYTVLKEEQWNS